MAFYRANAGVPKPTLIDSFVNSGGYTKTYNVKDVIALIVYRKTDHWTIPIVYPQDGYWQVSASVQRIGTSYANWTVTKTGDEVTITSAQTLSSPHEFEVYAVYK